MVRIDLLPKMSALRKEADRISEKFRCSKVDGIVYFPRYMHWIGGDYWLGSYSYIENRIRLNPVPTKTEELITKAIWNTFYHEMAHHVCFQLYHMRAHEEPFFHICEMLGGTINPHLLITPVLQKRYGHMQNIL